VLKFRYKGKPISAAIFLYVYWPPTEPLGYRFCGTPVENHCCRHRRSWRNVIVFLELSLYSLTLQMNWVSFTTHNIEQA